MLNKPVKIANSQGFWGDQINASARLLEKQPDLDYLTLDYLAEVSMAVLSMQKEKNPSLGYARDFLDTIRSIIPFWKNGSKVKVVANAGGLNPLECARSVKDLISKAGLPDIKIGVVSGDDVLNLLKADTSFKNKELISANAYLGAKGITDALLKGAHIVVTGRVADPSLTVGCAAAHYKWNWDDFNALAGATVAGHIIECGAQATGGIYTHWLDVPNPATIGFPIAEIDEDGSCVITKPIGTGGLINEALIKEQLLYEIGDPERYISPDCCVSFLTLDLKQEGENRVRVSKATGSPPPSTYKVSATYRDGYRAEGTLALFGRDLVKKGEACGNIILQRVRDAGYDLQRSCIETIGCGSLVPGMFQHENLECILRIAVQDARKEAVECFVKEIAPLVTCGPQGTTGYFSGRPKVKEAFGYLPTFINSNNIHINVEIIGTGQK